MTSVALTVPFSALSKVKVEPTSVALVGIKITVNPFMTDDVIRALNPQPVGYLLRAILHT
tara:strand:+ start:11158 stop:11337 length:180 start_codon:yes stop_codon:yes gene_type:complete